MINREEMIAAIQQNQQLVYLGGRNDKTLSYSILQTLHACPRKYELETVQGVTAEEDENIDFAMGHAVGHGIQQALLGKERDSIILEMFLLWYVDLELANFRKGKSFWHAVMAVDKFIAIKDEYFAGWEVAVFNNKPAIELNFKIEILGGYAYQGHIDLVLHHPETDAYKILEIKTTSFNNLHEAVYKNSAQALGYSIVLDQIAPGVSNYEVTYLAYKTGVKEYEVFDFIKSSLSRAVWIKQLLLDLDIIEHYKREGFFPMRGESCYSFFRPCKYFGICELSNSAFGKLDNLELDSSGQLIEQEQPEPQFAISLHISDIIERQMERI